jgi:hypothetical protein
LPQEIPENNPQNPNNEGAYNQLTGGVGSKGKTSKNLDSSDKSQPQLMQVDFQNLESKEFF